MTNTSDSAADGNASRAIFTHGIPFVLLFGLVGNGMVFALANKLKRHYSAFAFFFEAKTAADTAVILLIGFPRWLHTVTGLWADLDKMTACKINSWFFYSAQNASTLFLTAMTAQRAAGVVWPHSARNTFTTRLACAMIAVVVVVVPVFHANIVFLVFHEARICSCGVAMHFPENQSEVAWAWTQFSLIVTFPLVVIVCSDAVMLLRLRASAVRAEGRGGSQRRGRPRKARCRELCRNLQASTITWTVLVTSLIFWLLQAPAYLTRTLVLTGSVSEHFMDGVPYGVMELLTYVNTSANFYLYCLTGSRFRRESRALCQSLACCRRPLQPRLERCPSSHSGVAPRVSRRMTDDLVTVGRSRSQPRITPTPIITFTTTTTTLTTTTPNPQTGSSSERCAALRVASVSPQWPCSCPSSHGASTVHAETCDYPMSRAAPCTHHGEVCDACAMEQNVSELSDFVLRSVLLEISSRTSLDSDALDPAPPAVVVTRSDLDLAHRSDLDLAHRSDLDLVHSPDLDLVHSSDLAHSHKSSHVMPAMLEDTDRTDRLSVTAACCVSIEPRVKSPSPHVLSPLGGSLLEPRVKSPSPQVLSPLGGSLLEPRVKSPSPQVLSPLGGSLLEPRVKSPSPSVLSPLGGSLPEPRVKSPSSSVLEPRVKSPSPSLLSPLGGSLLEPRVKSPSPSVLSPLGGSLLEPRVKSPSPSLLSPHPVCKPSSAPHSVGMSKTSAHCLGVPGTDRVLKVSQSVGVARTSVHFLGVPRTSAQSVGVPRTSAHLIEVPRTSAQLIVLPRTSAQLVEVPRTSAHLIEVPRTSAQLIEVPVTSAQLVGVPVTSAHSVGVPRTVQSHGVTSCAHQSVCGGAVCNDPHCGSPDTSPGQPRTLSLPAGLPSGTRWSARDTASLTRDWPSAQLPSGQLRSGELRSGQLRSGELRSGQSHSVDFVQRPGESRSVGWHSGQSQTGEFQSGLSDASAGQAGRVSLAASNTTRASSPETVPLTPHPSSSV